MNLSTMRRAGAALTAVAAAGLAVVANAGTASAITGGGQTYGAFPFVAEVIYTPPPGTPGPGGLCTGTLVHPRFVLTAQHCAQTVPASTMSVRVGHTSRSTGGAYSSVTEIRKAPNYTGGHNDLVLLRLSTYITNVATVKLAQPSDSYMWDGAGNDSGHAVGWGVDSAGQFPSTLQFRPVSIYPPQQDSLNFKMLVVGAGPCGGDSGGPLIVNPGVYPNQVTRQAGVLKAAACGSSGDYSPVGEGANRDWIRYQIPDIDAPNSLTCRQGYVWRNAWNGDAVCVTPAQRSQTAADNAAASSRVDPNGAWGPNSCKSGWVWRVARSSDLVCVTPAQRDQAAADNNAAASRVN